MSFGEEYQWFAMASDRLVVSFADQKTPWKWREHWSYTFWTSACTWYYMTRECLLGQLAVRHDAGSGQHLGLLGRGTGERAERAAFEEVMSKPIFCYNKEKDFDHELLDFGSF